MRVVQEGEVMDDIKDEKDRKLLSFFRSDPQLKSEVSELLRFWPEKKSVVIDYTTLEKFGTTGLFYADQILKNPKRTSSDFEGALYELLPQPNRDEILRSVVFRFKGLKRKVAIRQIRSIDLKKLVVFDGVTRMVSQVTPKIDVAIYRCQACGNPVRVPQRSTKLEPPIEGICSNCSERARWRIDLEASTYINSQRVTVQEFQEGLRATEQPYTIDVEILDELCGVVNAGSRVTLTGIPRVVEKGTKDLSVETIIEANWIEMGEQSFTDMAISDEEIAAIIELSKSDNLLDKVASSIAPAIYGHKLVKSAIALQLFGGVTRYKKATRIRGDIHVLLLGDPGIAKSQLLDYVSIVSPRGVRASGGQSTNAGLTCAAKQDPDGNWQLEGGALVLADGGNCCIDEFDKMNKEDRAAIHNAMEKQQLDVNKAGLSATLMTRCSLTCAANPKSGRWDLFKNVPDQIDLPPTLLSRFDLIFIMRDEPNADLDSRIASHILDESPVDEDGLEPDFLRKYIAYAKKNFNPVRTRECNAKIHEFYMGLRGQGTEGAIPITPRKLEDCKRLAEASARLRLSNEAIESDADVAIALVSACLRSVAFDQRTGKFDMDKILCGVSASQRAHMSIINDHLKAVGATVPEKAIKASDLYLALGERLGKAEIDVAIEKLQQNAVIIVGPDRRMRLI